MQDVVENWDAFLKKASLRLRAKLGVDVVLKMSRAENKDFALRIKNQLEAAIKNNQLSGEFRIPDAAGDLCVVVLLASRLMQCSINIAAPTEGKTSSRIKWLLKQLPSEGRPGDQSVPDDLLVQVDWGWRQTSQARFGELKEGFDKLLIDGKGEEIPKGVYPRSYSLQWTRGISKCKGRSSVPVLEDIQKGIEEFYSCVVEKLRPYVPKAPELEGGYHPDNETITSGAKMKEFEISESAGFRRRPPAFPHVTTRKRMKNMIHPICSTQ